MARNGVAISPSAGLLERRSWLCLWTSSVHPKRSGLILHQLGLGGRGFGCWLTGVNCLTSAFLLEAGQKLLVLLV